MRTLSAGLLTFVLAAGVECHPYGMAPLSGSPVPPAPQEVLVVTEWTPTEHQEFTCRIIAHKAQGPDELSMRVLSIARGSGEEPVEVFRYETPDFLLGVSPLSEVNGRLLTVWMGATGYRIRVFAYLDGRVHQVLEEASKAFPEITFDSHGEETILVTELTIRKGAWIPVGGLTKVYKWMGREYARMGRVPWERRFECQSRESCAAIPVARRR